MHRFQSVITFSFAFVLLSFLTPGSTSADVTQYVRPSVFRNLGDAGKRQTKSVLDACRMAAAKHAKEKSLSIGAAHIEIARTLSNSPDAATDALLITTHLEQALALGHQPIKCHAMLGQIYTIAGQFETAKVHLEASIQKRPALGLFLARCYIMLRRPDDAVRVGRDARDCLSKKMRKELPGFFRAIHRGDGDSQGNDSSNGSGSAAIATGPSQSELGWLQCQELLESFDGAIRHLEQRIELGSDVWARRALSRLRLVQFDVMRRNTDRYRKTSFVAAFDVLMAASDSMPDHRSVIERLLRLLDSLPRAASADSIAVGDITQRLRTPHQMLVAASVLNDRGYLNQAIEVLRIAHGRQPDNPATLNNLAWYLATAEPPQLDEASRRPGNR